MGVETFIGSSGRVFPSGLKAAEILLKWMGILKRNENFALKLNHKLISAKKNKTLTFLNKNNEKVDVTGETIVFALGGASWKTGSDGEWSEVFEDLGASLKPFSPMNCGFESKWSDYFRTHVKRHPLKNVELRFDNKKIRTEVMITEFGIEGTGIYALSNLIRDHIFENKTASIFIDLLPDHSLESIISKLEGKKQKISLSNFLRKNFGLKKSEFTLVKELIPTRDFNESHILAGKLKNLEIVLYKARPIDEASLPPEAFAFLN